MKDFALKLEGCSKADRKKVVKAAKDCGYEWYDDDRFKDGRWHHITFITKEKHFYYYAHSDNHGVGALEMPKDWDKIKEALGVKEDYKFSKDEIVEGFKRWELFNRMNPSELKGSEVLISKSVSDVAEICAETLIKYIK